MTYAPATLKQLAAYWIEQGGVNLGIVGDTDHATRGVSYHLGKSQLSPDAYSIKTARDKAGLTEAASAIDLGRLGGTYRQLRAFSDWLAGRCLANTPGTRDVREVIYTKDGKTVVRFLDGQPKLLTGGASLSHLFHTHISFYRDSEFRDKTALFTPYFKDTTGDDMGTAFDFRPDTATGSVTLNGPGHYYRELATGKLVGPIDPAKFGTHRAIGPVDLVPPIDTKPGDRTTGVIVGLRSAALLLADVTFVPDHTHIRSTD